MIVKGLCYFFCYCVFIADDTLLIVTADHSHVFTMGGYPKRGNPIFGLNVEDDETEPDLAKDRMPYTVLGYGNGPGGERPNGIRQNLTGVDTGDRGYYQQATVWLSSESHGGEDVGMFENKMKSKKKRR